MAHKQYLLVKGHPRALFDTYGEQRTRFTIAVGLEGEFVIRVPDKYVDKFKAELKKTELTITKEVKSNVRRLKILEGSHRIRVYGKDLLVEIKANNEEQLFYKTKLVKKTLQEKYNIKTTDKCKWICYK